MTEATTRAPALRLATSADVPTLSNVLARSFETCPAWGWFLPPETPNRIGRMQRFFASLLRGVYLREGRECLVTEDVSGAVLVDPPNGWRMSARENLRLLAGMIPAFGRHVIRPIRGFNLLDKGHPSDPHFYLSVVGVDPQAKGRRIPESLLERVLDRCDAEGMPAYLETGRPKSRDFFVHYGFEVTEELELPDHGPPVWRLWRKAD